MRASHADVYSHDDLITFQGGKYCQFITWIIVEKLGNHRQARPALFDPVWLPSSTTDAGVVWEMEPEHGDEPGGSASPDGMMPDAERMSDDALNDAMVPTPTPVKTAAPRMQPCKALSLIHI